MRLPVWARKDSKSRLKFFLLTMASYHNDNCYIRSLAEAAEIHANTVYSSLQSGRMTQQIALAITRAVPDSGVKPLWLIAPDLIQLNEHGDIIE